MLLDPFGSSATASVSTVHTPTNVCEIDIEAACGGEMNSKKG